MKKKPAKRLLVQFIFDESSTDIAFLMRSGHNLTNGYQRAFVNGLMD